MGQAKLFIILFICVFLFIAQSEACVGGLGGGGMGLPGLGGLGGLGCGAPAPQPAPSPPSGGCPCGK
ncbi:unnamed protein product [Cylicocyclus nassatus]|uniref:Uncharacterized protein n=1 Tax=Cylicocyclus nassatus TaxID=53992 RepID=A0AA36DUW2_CYLNA|nr:unnamed protein product [Cylicocyclus nassatus]